MALRRMRHSERTAACLIHMIGIIPIWGGLGMAWFLWRFRGRSRPVVFHAQQALFFHFGALLCLTAPLIVMLLGKMIAVLRPGLGEVVITTGGWGAMAVWAANIGYCLYAANRVVDGHDFNYPYFGKSLRPAFDEPPVVRRNREFHTYMTPVPPGDELITPASSTSTKKPSKKPEATPPTENIGLPSADSEISESDAPIGSTGATPSDLAPSAETVADQKSGTEDDAPAEPAALSSDENASQPKEEAETTPVSNDTAAAAKTSESPEKNNGKNTDAKPRKRSRRRGRKSKSNNASSSPGNASNPHVAPDSDSSGETESQPGD